MRPPPGSTLFPYTTLFRSWPQRAGNPPLKLALRSRLSYWRSEEHTSELQSRSDLVCRLLLEKKKTAPPCPEHESAEAENNFTREEEGVMPKTRDFYFAQYL